MGEADKDAGSDASRQKKCSQRGMRQGLCLCLVLACHVKQCRTCCTEACVCMHENAWLTFIC